MSEYTDIKNNTFPIIHTSRIDDTEREEVQLKIVEELYAIFAS